MAWTSRVCLCVGHCLKLLGKWRTSEIALPTLLVCRCFAFRGWAKSYKHSKLHGNGYHTPNLHHVSIYTYRNIHAKKTQWLPSPKPHEYYSYLRIINHRIQPLIHTSTERYRSNGGTGLSTPRQHWHIPKLSRSGRRSKLKDMEMWWKRFKSFCSEIW